MCLPSGELNAAELTKEVCPWRGFPTWSPVCASQSLIVLSFESDTMCLSSGENATEMTDEVCPWRGFPTWPPVCISQSLIVLSFESDTMCFPSGENATELTEEMCPWSGFPTWPLVCASQSLIVLSFEPDTIYLPSGENATDQTQISKTTLTLYSLYRKLQKTTERYLVIQSCTENTKESSLLTLPEIFTRPSFD